MSFKVEFAPPGLNVLPITMIYSGDTRPNYSMLDLAKGIDVLVHEVVMPPDQWAAHNLGIPVDQVPPPLIDTARTIINSSHTTQGALGYLLSQWMGEDALPRLTCATHFQAQDDTVALARQSLDAYNIPRSAYTFPADFMMVNVTSDQKTAPVVRRLDVSKYAFAGQGTGVYSSLNRAKYHDTAGNGDPYQQIDDETWIPYTGYLGNDKVTYNEDGY
ncbi:MAG: hypothetical protein IPK16_08600 [Anaerolineales bacterium]|nr:hypothetical protein [Anaerolineales bacterium]